MISERPALLLMLSLFFVMVALLGVINLVNHSSQNLREIYTLKKKLLKTESELSESRLELNKIALLRYKDKVFKKKYPRFSNIVEAVFKKSKDYNLNPNLILAIIQIESSFNPYAVSSRGAFGLMQVNLSVWKDELNIKPMNIFDIEYNIDLGLRILSRYLTKAKGNILKALHIYNNGYNYNNHKYKSKVVSTVFYAHR